ncbi:MAG: nucleotidyltransferase [Candidatus Margulisiibacteriota bacterium]
MSVADWFSTFCSTLQVQDGGTISYRYKRITRQLNSDFWDTDSETSHSLCVGSYGRNTAIQGFSDLDMVFELPANLYSQYNDYYGNGQSSLLQVVRTSMKKTYSTSDISGDGQVVSVSFQDGITFEIVPVFLSQSGGYIHPCSNNGGTWKTTNPRPEIQAIRDRNSACNRNLIPLCRMMRAWKNQWGVPIGGLLIDALAYQFIGNWTHRDKSYLYYDYMCRDFFEWMANQSRDQEYWLAPGSGQRVNGKELFQYKAKQCYNLALEAIAHESADPKREYSAKSKWREIFGTTFPN